MKTGICRWCGAEVEHGKEQEHFNEKRNLKCSECRWWYVDYDEYGKANGNYCRFAEIAEKRGMECRCVKDACRERGIKFAN